MSSINSVKIATWNVNSIRVRLEQLLVWLQNEQPDILVLQETKTPDEFFPKNLIEEVGYQVIFQGQTGFNGVAILTKHEISNITKNFSGILGKEPRILAANILGIRVVNVYVPNGASVDSDKYQYKLNWLQALNQWLQSELQQHQQLVILGDFNIAPADIDVHDPKIWQGSVLTSDAERNLLQEMMSLGLSDVFRHLKKEEQQFSWWDYRQGAFRRNNGLRIDLILACSTLVSLSHECVMHKEMRALERPSDHIPVVAHFLSPSQ